VWQNNNQWTRFIVQKKREQEHWVDSQRTQMSKLFYITLWNSIRLIENNLSYTNPKIITYAWPKHYHRGTFEFFLDKFVYIAFSKQFNHLIRFCWFSVQKNKEQEHWVDSVYKRTKKKNIGSSFYKNITNHRSNVIQVLMDERQILLQNQKEQSRWQLLHGTSFQMNSQTD